MKKLLGFVRHAVQPMMIVHAWDNVLSAPCLCILLCCYRSLLFVCFVGLYIQLILFVEIFVLTCLCTFCYSIIGKLYGHKQIGTTD